MREWIDTHPSHLGYAKSVREAVKAGDVMVREALRVHRGVPRLPWKKRMRRRAQCCSTKSLWAYDGTKVCSSRALTVDEMLSKLPKGVNLYGPFSPARRSAVIGNTRDRLSSFIVYLKKNDASEFVPIFDDSVFTKRLILCVWDSYLYVGGHCIAIWPPSHTTSKKRWAVRDPWRIRGTAVSINRRQLKLVIAGCRWMIM